MSANRHRVKIEFFLGKTRNAQLSLIATATNTAHMAARIIKSVCDNGFYHWQLSHNDQLMSRLEAIAENQRIAKSQLVTMAVLDYVRNAEIEQAELARARSCLVLTEADLQEIEMHRQITGIPILDTLPRPENGMDY